MTGQQLITIFIQLSFLRKKKHPVRMWVDKERDKKKKPKIEFNYFYLKIQLLVYNIYFT